MKVKFSYLERQFANVDEYLAEVRSLVLSTDFTLGQAVAKFEQNFAKLCQLPYAVGVGSGTDALILSLKIFGIGRGDEVITAPNTYIATVGAIAMTGATPVFVDINADFTINSNLIEQAITPRTKAIIPVHFGGNVADMPAIMEIARRHHLLIIEDACMAIAATFNQQPVGSWGETTCFSLHPLKNLNVWGDGGIIVTRSSELYAKLQAFRNHGLINRDEAIMFGHNSRLDSLQAVVANRLIKDAEWITSQRIAYAQKLDQGFADLNEFIAIPPRPSYIKQVYHLYILRVKQRDRLLAYLHEHGIEAKIHWPIPVHLQKTAAYLGYKLGDFPVTEADMQTTISLPLHQHLTTDEIDYMIEKVRCFYIYQ
jgi:dTDP-4-amino-4,6-dideoxygalactose transaminase